MKCDFLWTLPANCRFIISGTYPLVTNVGPIVDFSTLLRLVAADFHLSQAEVSEFFRVSYLRTSAQTAGYCPLQEPILRHVIATHCNGHIDALAASTREILKSFSQCATVSVEEVISFYLFIYMLCGTLDTPYSAAGE
eukprot:gene23808-28832_t